MTKDQHVDYWQSRAAALDAEIDRLREALKGAGLEHDRLREALTIISEHQRAPEWVKRIATTALALAKEAGR